MRVVPDINVLLSGFAYPGSAPGRIDGAWRVGWLEIVLSRFILDELARVLPRRRHRTRFSDADCPDFVDALSVMIDVVEPDPAALEEAEKAARGDPTDIPVLTACIAARANHLVTGDKDLLALTGQYPVVTPADFCARYSP